MCGDQRTQCIRYQNGVCPFAQGNQPRFCKESGDGCDEGVHAGVFLGGSRGCESLDPVGRQICLAGKPREIGGVAAWTFGCGGVGCEGVGTCPPPVKGEGPVPNSEGVGARDSTTTDGLGPPVKERGSGEASPIPGGGLAQGSRVVFFWALGTIV